MTPDKAFHSDAAPSATVTLFTAENSPSQSCQGTKDADINLGPTNSTSTTGGTVKRRAPKRSAQACAACRERKVRCDVLDGAPCRNCRWNEVDCVVLESRRYHKTRTSFGAGTRATTSAATRPTVGSRTKGPRGKRIRAVGGNDNHHSTIPIQPRPPMGSDQASPFPLPSPEPKKGASREPPQGPDTGTSRLPSFIKPLSADVTVEDVKYLRAKGALTLPPIYLQRALLRAFIEYVYPCLPLLDLPEFLHLVGGTEDTHSSGQVSLLLYQAILFSGTAFVDAKLLRDAGFSSRRSARRCCFQRTKLLHDLDCESDRLVVVQALLLMSYWHESPDDKRDMWHWIGVAVGLAYTIGLHRDPSATGMPTRKQRLWKRVWWSCYIRDRLISLGLRRPTHIADENYGIPMVAESDFEVEALYLREDPGGIVPTECNLLRNTPIQLELAAISVAMAKLCTCVGSMLRVRDSALTQDTMQQDCTAEGMYSSTNRKLSTLRRVAAVDFELMAWAEALPGSCRYQSPTRFQTANDATAIIVQRAMLHMIYYATISALHRLSLLGSSSNGTPQQARNMSRYRVHDATTHITHIASELYELQLEKYLPTTGITVILPAMTVHLLELKGPVLRSREKAARGFLQCMRVIKSLRETYAAADHAVDLFEKTLRTSGIDVNAVAGGCTALSRQSLDSAHGVLTPPPENAPYMTSYEALFGPKATQYQSLQTVEPVPQSVSAALDSFNTRPGTAASVSVDDNFDQTAGGMTPGDSPEYTEPPHHVESVTTSSDFDWGATGISDYGLNQWLFPTLADIELNQGFGANAFADLGGQGEMEWLASAEPRDEP